MGPDQTDLPAVFELVVPAGTRAGQVIAVDRAVLRIGRQTSNHVVLPDAKVSRQHARLEQQGDGLLVTDEGSSNGTYVNGSRITTPTVLRPGDILAVGASHLRVQAVAVELMAYAPGPPAPTQPAAPRPPPPPAPPRPPPPPAGPPPPRAGCPLPRPLPAAPGPATPPDDPPQVSPEKVPPEPAPAAPSSEPARKVGLLQRLLAVFKRGG